MIRDALLVTRYGTAILSAADNCHAQNGHSPLVAWHEGLETARAFAPLSPKPTTTTRFSGPVAGRSVPSRSLLIFPCVTLFHSLFRNFRAHIHATDKRARKTNFTRCRSDGAATRFVCQQMTDPCETLSLDQRCDLTAALLIDSCEATLYSRSFALYRAKLIH